MQEISAKWIQNANGDWDISFKNGVIEMENVLNSIVKHIVFCNGYVEESLQKIRNRRAGFLGDFLSSVFSFSTSWFFYTQNIANAETAQKIQNSILTALLSHNYIKKLQSQGNDVKVKCTLTISKTINIIVYIGKDNFTYNL